MMTNAFKKITSIWVITVLLLFILAIAFGITMRFGQASDITISPITFYSFMTTHGLTMIGIWSVAGMAAVNYLLARYVKVSTTLSVVAYVLTVIGVVLLWLSTFVGHLHVGWTFLYPLPFKIAWEQWATPMFLISLTIMGAAWLIWAIGMVLEILKNYSLKQMFAWQYFSKKQSTETPPFILITSVSLIGIIISLITAVILLVFFFIELVV